VGVLFRAIMLVAGDVKICRRMIARTEREPP
jgi:hypothetical protein